MSSKKIPRREFLKRSASGLALAMAAGSLSGFSFFPHIKNKNIARKVLALGIDGMDPQILNKLVSKGKMPTFAKLIQEGRYRELQTTLPPQSPVAWASFITGANPGKHGIYDFVARDPKTFTPYLSTSRSYPSGLSLKLGGWQLPLKSGRVELLRKGLPFWSPLEEHDIPVVLSQLPANFPVQQSETKALSGMGTPDLLGTYGTSTVFTEEEIKNADSFTGTRVIRIKGSDHTFKTSLGGPANSFRKDGNPVEAPLTIYRDPSEDSVNIVLSDQEVLLRKGEWSKWIPVKFQLVPLAASIKGIVRIYLQSVHPKLRLYVSPINVDPLDSDLPISSPKDYSVELAEHLGRFYTQGFPEDTKALSNDIFSDQEFFNQAKLVLEERRAAYEYSLQNFKEGVLFFYFSSVDQCSHMLYRAMYPEHPLFPKDAPEEVYGALPYLYKQMDDLLRQTLDGMDSDTTLLVLSDHGFAPFRREVNLSTWLAENGYTAFTDRSKMHTTDLYEYVNWAKTSAYVLGINSIYLNLKGREKQGSVEPQKAEQIKNEIIEKLRVLKDPDTGEQVALAAYDGKKAYWGPEVINAPDIVVGYNRGYRISDSAVLGKFPEGIVVDRKDKWSADHCMDPSLVPGVFLSNKDIISEKPGLWDLAPTILHEFGIETPKEMDGHPVLKA